eukprot:scaffold1083_cov132-Skeletonema_menzelii.AAC.3
MCPKLPRSVCQFPPSTRRQTVSLYATYTSLTERLSSYVIHCNFDLCTDVEERKMETVILGSTERTPKRTRVILLRNGGTSFRKMAFSCEWKYARPMRFNLCP